MWEEPTDSHPSSPEAGAARGHRGLTGHDLEYSQFMVQADENPAYVEELD